jgi:hypothetical protein
MRYHVWVTGSNVQDCGMLFRQFRENALMRHDTRIDSRDPSTPPQFPFPIASSGSGALGVAQEDRGWGLGWNCSPMQFAESHKRGGLGLAVA